MNTTPTTTTPKGHPHAALMAEFAKDAATMEWPWEAWEWWSERSEAWIQCIVMPRWTADIKYRRKPRTIRIGNIDVPEPVRQPLEVGTVYYVPLVSNSGYVHYVNKWAGDSTDMRLLTRGLVHLTAEAAVIHGRALVALTSATE